MITFKGDRFEYLGPKTWYGFGGSGKSWIIVASVAVNLLCFLETNGFFGAAIGFLGGKLAMLYFGWAVILDARGKSFGVST